MRIITQILLLITLCAEAQAQKAKNVILFLADAAGVPTVNAASLHGHGEPQKLFVQSWPHLALSDTSTASAWVTDSAAGMTAIVTGRKTQNGVLSLDASTVRGAKDGAVLKTILEYAEERRLSTGVMTNVNIADATPAACYSHVNERSKFGEIFLQLFSPWFGDGVDVLAGVGRKAITDSMKKLGQDLDMVSKAKGRPVYKTLADVPAGEMRPLVVQDSPIDLPAAADMALNRLSKNPRGYFLMIEWDAHTDNVKKGLDNVVAFDKLIRSVAQKVNLKETLLLFTADHSFDLSLYGGKRGEPLLNGLDEWTKANAGKKPEYTKLPSLRVFDDHTGEEVIATAMGPGSERVNGFMPNTQLFRIMMQALGWQETASAVRSTR
ncbi:MAG: alkaline phosphatase [Candidatus Solibacter sp.]